MIEAGHMSLPLAGLILVDDDGLIADSPSPGLVPVAGQTLIEYQVRVARACGAGHIVVLVDRIPALLVSAFDRLRADGIDIDIARDASEVADRIHPEEQLIVFASGVVASRLLVMALVQKGVPTLLTLRDTPQTSHFERIDALDRWGGLALLNGKLLRETAAILGDWTLGPTLLRVALQAGAGRLPYEGSGLALVRDEQDAHIVANALASGNGQRVGGFWHSQVVGPVVRLILSRLIGRNVSPDILALLPLGLMGISMLAAATGWLATAFGLFLLAGFPAMAAQIMADIGAQPDKVLRWIAEAQLPILVALLGFAGWSLNVSGLSWGPLVLALWAGVALFLQPRFNEGELWYADADLIAFEMLLASLIGQPVLGLMVAVAHSVLTQFWLVRRSG